MSFEPQQELGDGDKGVTISSLKVVTYNYDLYRKELVDTIITNELPLKFVNNVGFRRFC